ncbi:MAG: hypothetical protein R2708_28550 [Vicinamibacterales bacterium]
MRVVVISLVSVVLCLPPCAPGAAAQPRTVDDMLASVRLSIAVSHGRLEGPGAELLRAAIKATPYVLIGEDHGLAEVPVFSAAVFRELAPLGVRDLVVEVGPEAGRRLTRLLGAADPMAEARRWQARYPFSLAFYNLAQELEFLREARAAAGPGLRVVGVDQELMGAGRMLLEAIGTKDPAIPGLLAAERAAYATAASTGNPLDLFMMRGEAGALGALRDRLVAGRRATDAALVASLLDSRRVYELNATSGFESNLTRAAPMKRYYVEQLLAGRQGAPPPALFARGVHHVMKARTRSTAASSAITSRNWPTAWAGRRCTSWSWPPGAASGASPASAGPTSSPLWTRSGRRRPTSLRQAAAVRACARRTGHRRSPDLRRWANRQRDLDPRPLRLLFGFDLAAYPRGHAVRRDPVAERRRRASPPIGLTRSCWRRRPHRALVQPGHRGQAR